MGQPHEIGQPQAVLASPIGGGGEHGQFAIGGRSEGEIARGLGEVDGLAFLLERTGLGGKQMHQRSLQGRTVRARATMPARAVDMIVSASN